MEELTYEQFGAEIVAFGAGLRALGMKPIPSLSKGQTFDDAEGPFVMVIFEDTCKQWTVGLHGAMTQSMTVATCYATLGEDAVVAAVNETQATTLLLNWKKAEKFASLAHAMPTLKTIIASTYEMPKGTPTPLPPSRKSSIQILSTNEVVALGQREIDQYPPVPPKLTNVAVIMYTSGSTGKVCLYYHVIICSHTHIYTYIHYTLSLSMYIHTLAKRSRHDS
jgi:long-chain acyl-CoA synthetase